jgi:hypothetical protein
MRFREFFTEATLNLTNFGKRNRHYWKNILDMIKNGDDFKLNDGSYVTPHPDLYKTLYNIWDGTDFASPEQILLIRKNKFKTIDGYEVPWGNIYKSKEIQNNPDPNAEDESQSSKFWNLGNVVEGIMGAAVTAKFLNPDATVTPAKIMRILKSSKYESSLKANTVRRSYSGKIRNDSVQFTLSLNQKDYLALSMSFDENPNEQLTDYKGADEIFKAYDNAAEYVNSAKTVKDALDRVIGDPHPNSVLIESEGAAAENQRGTKADLFITIDGKRERLLSLKSGVIPQVGQMSGASFENLEKFFKSVLGFGLPSSMNNDIDFPKDSKDENVKKYILQNGFMKAYKHIYNSLKSTLSGDNDYKEYNFTSQVFKGLKYHSTLDEEVIIVYISPNAKKAYMEISIGKELREALHHFDLQPQLTNTTLKIVGVPKDEIGKKMSNGKTEVLFQLRSSTQGNALRNAVEIGKLVKSLADLEKIRERAKNHNGGPPLDDKNPAPQQPAEKPVPQQQAAPKPTAPVKPIAPTAQTPDLKKSPLTAKWLSDR